MEDDVPRYIRGRDIAFSISAYPGEENIFTQLQIQLKEIVEILGINVSNKDHKIARNFFDAYSGYPHAMSEKFSCAEVGEYIRVNILGIILDGNKDIPLSKQIQDTVVEVQKKISELSRLVGIQNKIYQKILSAESLGAVGSHLGALSCVHPSCDVIAAVLKVTGEKFGLKGLKKVFAYMLASEYLHLFWSQKSVILYFLMQIKLLQMFDSEQKKQIIEMFLSSVYVYDTLVHQVDMDFLKKIKSDIGKGLFVEIFSPELSKKLG